MKNNIIFPPVCQCLFTVFPVCRLRQKVLDGQPCESILLTMTIPEGTPAKGTAAAGRTVEGTPFYRLIRFAGTPLLNIFFRLRGEGLENIPAAGPFILAANHVSYLDPLVLGATCPRPVHFIMLQEFWEKPVIGWIARKSGSFPVDQQGSAAGALRRALGVLRSGKVLGIFPEGGRSTDGSLQRGKGGAALLVMKAGVPLLPAAIVGADRALPKGRAFPRPARIIVRYGRPITVPPPSSPDQKREFLDTITARVMEAIGQLAKE
ncbi:lysophospholipid acyltransferase family protein [Candidatus Moduliflexota bacterium]